MTIAVVTARMVVRRAAYGLSSSDVIFRLMASFSSGVSLGLGLLSMPHNQLYSFRPADFRSASENRTLTCTEVYSLALAV